MSIQNVFDQELPIRSCHSAKELPGQAIKNRCNFFPRLRASVRENKFETKMRCVCSKSENRESRDRHTEGGREGGEIKFTDVAFLHEAKLKRVCPDSSND